MTGEVRIAVAAAARVGEGPVWDRETGLLLWVDIVSGQIHTSDPTNGRTRTLTVPTMVGAAAPREAGGFVAATTEGFAVVDDAGGLDTRCPILPDGIRMNDAKVDSAGRFWAGSTAMDFADGQGALHLLRPDWSTESVIEGLTQPNGLGWSPDDRTFYLVDTARRILLAFDFDRNTAELSGAKVLVRYQEPDTPDGLCVDADGRLWIAMWGSGRLERRLADGTLDGVIELPVVQPTCCAFGGVSLDILYVTSAREGMDPADLIDSPDGSVLAVSGSGAQGLPMTRFAG